MTALRQKRLLSDHCFCDVLLAGFANNGLLNCNHISGNTGPQEFSVARTHGRRSMSIRMKSPR